ncbi:MAG: hypothetical protein ACJ8F7_11790 [Gemmataceae bacterium]
MAATLLAKCPGCQKEVRIPPEWANRAVRCKHCGLVSQANVKPAAARPVAATPAARPGPAPVVPNPTQYISDGPTLPTASVAPRAAGSHDPFAFNDLAASPAPAAGGRRYRRKNRGWITALLAVLFLALCVGGTIVGVIVFGPKIRARMQAEADAATASSSAVASIGDGNRSAGQIVPAAKEEYPRRLLGVSVNNYLYANPISYGTDPTGRLKRDFTSVLERFANKLDIPKSQVFQLSDGAPGGASKPPLKPIIMQTVSNFVETSRAQDRVILILVGHSVEIDGKPYLVPLEGDLEDAKSLVPLDWVMSQLAACKAQQKILIADISRYDPSRGNERPSGGKLAAKTEELLKNPPPGVQVVSACSKDQYSYEFDDYAVSQGFEIKGGAFLAFFLKAFGEGVSGIQRPGDPIHIDQLAKSVIKSTKEMFTRVTINDKMESVTEIEQEPFLAGEMKGEPLAYDAAEPPAKAVEIPAPEKVFDKGLAAKKDLEAIMNEINVPPVKLVRATGNAVRFEAVVPFPADVMNKYKGDATIAEIKGDPEKYPLRIAVINAVEKMRELGGNTGDLPEEIRSQASDAQKAMLKNLQKGPARVMADLKDVLEALEKVGEDRKSEKSKRWQAHYDYILAEVKSKYAYMHEYSLMTGQVRRDALPELDKNKGQTGWRLASSEKLQSNQDVREQVNDARKLLKKIVKDYPGTPWEVLAKRERFTALGLEWVPTNFGAENVTATK